MKKIKIIARLASITPERNFVKLSKSDTSRKNVRSKVGKETPPFPNDHSDIKSSLLLFLDSIDFLFMKSKCNYTKQVLYLNKIVYNLKSIFLNYNIDIRNKLKHLSSFYLLI